MGSILSKIREIEQEEEEREAEEKRKRAFSLTEMPLPVPANLNQKCCLPMAAVNETILSVQRKNFQNP